MIRQTILIIVLFFAGGFLYAQDSTEVIFEELSPPVEDYTESTYEDQDYTSTEEETTTTEHVLIEPGALDNTKSYASEKLPVKKFDEEKWKDIVGKTNYQEEKEEAEPEPEKEEEEKQSSSDSTEIKGWGDAGWLRIVAFCVIGGLIAFILYMVLKNISFTHKINQKVVLSETDHSAPVEDIQALDIQTALQKALANKNYKLAVRLYFLDILKALNETGTIVWKKDKTNRDYLDEVYAKQYHTDTISHLTLAYEQVWYGEHTLSDDSYQKLFTEFESMHRKINTINAS